MPALSSSPTGPSKKRWPTRPKSATNGLVLLVGKFVRRRRRRAAWCGLRGERVPPRRRQGLPHLAHRRPRYGTAQLHLRVDRHPAVGPPGGMAGFTRRLAEVARLLQLARLSRCRSALRPERRRRSEAREIRWSLAI